MVIGKVNQVLDVDLDSLVNDAYIIILDSVNKKNVFRNLIILRINY